MELIEKIRAFATLRMEPSERQISSDEAKQLLSIAEERDRLNTQTPITISRLTEEVKSSNRRLKRYKEALEEIKKGEGAYDMDRLKHASNCIENMKQIAEQALTGQPKEGGEE